MLVIISTILLARKVTVRAQSDNKYDCYCNSVYSNKTSTSNNIKTDGSGNDDGNGNISVNYAKNVSDGFNNCTSTTSSNKSTE